MTIIVSANDPQAAVLCAEAINDGQLIVLPTDTVYGVAARLSDDAIMRLYLAKDRQPDKAIPLLLASADDVARVAFPPSTYEQRIIEAFWPGPLTLVLNKRPELPKYVSNVPTVGVRVPANPITCTIIQVAGGVLAVSSANKSGNPAAHTIENAIEQLGDAIAVAVDGGIAMGQAA